jgi:hypothetical protein
LAKTSKPAGAENDEPGTPAQPHDVLGDFAADLGRFLGGVQTRATSWLQQRKDIADQLTQIRDTANQYLQQLGTEGSHLVERFEKARRGRPPGSRARPAAPAGSAEAPAPAAATGKRTMSPEARERIAEAQRKRWAKLRRKSSKA